MTSLDRAPISSWIRSQTLSRGRSNGDRISRLSVRPRRSRVDPARCGAVFGTFEIFRVERARIVFVVARSEPGAKGACRGHSLAANARLCYRMRAGSIDLDQDGIENEANLQDDFSPDWCYYRCQAASGIRGDNGATIEGGKRVGLEEGIVREIDLPYQNTYEPSRANDPQLRVKAQAFKFGRYSLLETAQAVFDWVGSGQGGIDWGPFGRFRSLAVAWSKIFRQARTVEDTRPREVV